MNKFILSLLLCAVTTIVGHASALTDAHITGHVVSCGDNEHLAWATIRVVGTTYGTTTDATGHYLSLIHISEPTRPY